MIAHVLTDLGYGDSGKGSTVDYLCRTLPGKKIVVRLQGGHQVGHTVKFDDQLIHEFRNFGSGTFQKIPIWYGPETTCCPTAFMLEYEKVKSFNPINIYHPDVMITTSYDIMYNRWQEDQRGDNRHGSVGMGFNATITRNEKCKFTVVMLLASNYITKMKLESIRQYYINLGVPSSVFNNIDIDRELNDINDFSRLTTCNIEDAVFFNGYNHIIFEANQGFLLDQKYGMFPHVTRSTTTCRPPLDFLLQWQSKVNIEYIHMYDISRIYHTRHGAGPFTVYPIELKNTEVESNHWNDYQRDFKTSKLDLRLLFYAMDINAFESLYHPLHDYITNYWTIFTCVDQLTTESVEYVDDYGNHEVPLNYFMTNMHRKDINNSVMVSNNPKMDLRTIIYADKNYGDVKN